MADTTGPRSRPRGDRGQVRIGDAEREEVLEALQEHLASGRLTVDEYEQRAERATAARYAEDLDDLLTDLPPTPAQEERRRAEAPPWAQWRRSLPLPTPLLIGLVVLVIIALPGPPFLLFPLLWIGLFLAFARHWGGRGRWGGPYAPGGPRRWGAQGWDGPRGWEADRAWDGPRGCGDGRGRHPHSAPDASDRTDESRVV